ncbi:hypothetical protein OSB04_008900 [Centaurea solstitialis]|uniref:Uncharacterized protein n=1 Tax=Centaurea solstitialis TaxID=347529 RepID=A0AA38TZF7_9ASTR|nr:hypothetical protein OSB04_008900 [Centaurea solstitialis]
MNNVIKQPNNYFCWNDRDEGLVPSSIARLWENNNKGTGVFISHNVNSRIKNKPRRKSYNKGAVYKPVGIEGLGEFMSRSIGPVHGCGGLVGACLDPDTLETRS